MLKLIFVCFVSAYSFSIEASQTWEDVLKERELCFYEANEIVQEQYLSYKEGKLPKIADSTIKEIPIVDNGEALIDIRNFGSDRIQLLPDPPKSEFFYGSEYNAGFPHSGKIRQSVSMKLERLQESLDIMAEEFGFEKGKIIIKVFEGLRDLESQRFLYKRKMKEIMESNSSLTKGEAQNETSKWVSPYKSNVPVHSTGAAIDIRLSYNNEFIDMGPFGVIWGDNPSSPTFSENITTQQKLNRLFLLKAAAENGLINYPYEWWHFSDGDRYSEYWNQKNTDLRIARYGSL